MKRPRLLDGEDIPPKPVQRRSAEKRERLVQAALTLFGERGYEHTSLGDIARRANMAVGGIYLYFRGKRQLLLVLMDELLERLAALDLTPQTGRDARSAIHDLLTRALHADLTYRGAMRAWSEAVRGDAALEALNRKVRAWTSARVRAAFEHWQRLPGARPGVDAAALARTMDVLFWNQPGDVDEFIDSTTHLIYHALFLDQPR